MQIKKKSGMSLIELLVSLSILSIGMAGFSVLFLKTWSSNSFVLESGQAVSSASRALDMISKDLRKAKQGDNSEYPIKLGDGFDLIFYSNVDDDAETERVHYFLDDNQNLKRGISNPDSSAPPIYPSGDESVDTIASYIVNSKIDPEPIFYYYDKNYSGTESALDIPILVTEARLIRVHLWVNIKPIVAPENVNLEAFIEIRNLNENLY